MVHATPSYPKLTVHPHKVSTGICLQSFLGQDVGFGGFAFALRLPELLNINLITVRAKLRQTSLCPNGPQILVPSYDQ